MPAPSRPPVPPRPPSIFQKLFGKLGKSAATNIYIGELDFERHLEARDMREQHRRKTTQRKIEMFTMAERAAADQQEKEVRRRYDDERKAIVARHCDELRNELVEGMDTSSGSTAGP